MTKAEIVEKISRETGLEKDNVLAVVEEFMKVVKNSLANDDNVYLRGFGSFIIKKRAAKKARNITKGEFVMVPEHNIPYFKPSDAFCDMLK